MSDDATADFDFSADSDPDEGDDVLVPSELLREVRSLIRAIKRRNDIDAAWMGWVQHLLGSPVAKIVLGILVARMFGIDFALVLDGLRVLVARA